MVKKDLKPARVGFNNQQVGLEEGEEEEEVVWAKAIPATNTLWVKVPEHDEQKIAIAAAIVAIEEFLHGEWVVALMYQMAHLEEAANEALRHLYTEEGTKPDSEYLKVVVACNQTLQKITTAIEPFVETVDKFQQQRAHATNPGYIDELTEGYEEEHGSDAAKEFGRALDEQITKDLHLVAGRVEKSNNTTYINPAYYRALSHLIARFDKPTTGTTALEDDSSHAWGRTVAEAAARATLDIPRPIAPLGGADYSWFEPPSAMDVGEPPLEYHTLEDRYEVTDADFEYFKQLVANPERDHGDEQSRQSDLDAIEQLEWSGVTREDVAESWVMRAFINVCTELRDLREHGEFDFTDPDGDALRQELIKRVHGVPEKTATNPHDGWETALLDIPRQRATPSEEDDDSSQAKYPLETIIQNSFESHGKFGAVIFHLEGEESGEGDTRHMLNWHAITNESSEENDHPDLTDYPHVPSGIDGYKQLWEYHWTWSRLRQDLMDSYVNYRETLIDRLDDVLTSAELNTEIARAETALLRGDTPSVEDYDGVQNEPRALASKDPIPAYNDLIKAQKKLNSKPLAVLRRVAEQNDITVRQAKDDIESVDCPLCRIRPVSCGPENTCIREELCRGFEEQLPDLVKQLVSAELEYIQDH